MIPSIKVSSGNYVRIQDIPIGGWYGHNGKLFQVVGGCLDDGEIKSRCVLARDAYITPFGSSVLRVELSYE